MTVVSYAVSASTDDASIEILSPGGYSATRTTNGLPRGGTTDANYGSGWRFNLVDIAQGATIASAYITLVKSGTLWNTYPWRWCAQQADDAATFSSGSPPGSRTVGTVVAETLNINHIDATAYNFPNSSGNKTSFGAVVQAVTDRAGWAAGQNIAILQQVDSDAGSGTNNDGEFWATWDHATLAAPQITIDYTAPATKGIVYPSMRGAMRTLVTR